LSQADALSQLLQALDEAKKPSQPEKTKLSDLFGECVPATKRWERSWAGSPGSTTSAVKFLGQTRLKRVGGGDAAEVDLTALASAMPG